VRWDDLFGDLEREWEALGESDRRAEIAERTRAEFAQLSLLDRLRGSVGQQVRLRTLNGHDVGGELVRVGSDFVLVAAPRSEYVIALQAVAAVRDVGPRSLQGHVVGPVVARLGLASLLRRVAADRSLVWLTTADGRTLRGRLQRVGSDFLELAEADAEGLDGGTGRALGAPVLVAFGAVSLLRRDAVEG
jgi:small nuclear ribonucleoprotein (snRNP)-like protein